MGYLFLTGATGLLGSYLLRDTLRAGRRMAVLVRPSKWESGRQRIESILARYENKHGLTFPRPVVIEGNLAGDDLDLDGSALRWIARHCAAIVHNAASLTFQGSDPEGEPWLSNVRGTSRILELCRRTGIGRLHYVSTAYVCGLRTGRILESDLDIGQPMGNDYERSKVEAEKLVRAADFLPSVTIYRPSIIVGDSQTGYTTSFHGYYALLKLAHTLVSKLVLGATAGQTVIESFALSGSERKNFVPVDWVSAAMSYILDRPEHHGKTYHLVARRPLSLSRMARVQQEAVERYSTLADESDAWKCDGDWFARNFREQMIIYQSYWRDDPKFDDTNTAAAAPHLPCVELDEAMLMRMSKFAIETNFGKPRPRPIKPEFDVQQHLQGFLRNGESMVPRCSGGPCLGLQVDGPGGGQWKLLLRDGRIVAVEGGLSAQCSAIFCLNSHTFERLAARQLSVGQAVEAGRVVIEGNGMEPRHLEAVLQAAVVSEAAVGAVGDFALLTPR